MSHIVHSDPRLTGPERHVDDTRRRFLADVVARVPLDRIEEVHLFTPIRQGGAETGVAVVVARRLTDEAIVEPTPDELAAVAPDDVPNEAGHETSDETGDEAGAEPMPHRHTIFSARYRYTLRGPDRGRWDVDVVEEADAPLPTVAAVVRGVQRRAGDSADADRLDAGAIARALGAPETA